MSSLPCHLKYCRDAAQASRGFHANWCASSPPHHPFSPDCMQLDGHTTFIQWPAVYLSVGTHITAFISEQVSGHISGGFHGATGYS